MEEIEMQHRIHHGETTSMAEYESTRRHHLKLTIGHDLSGGGMVLRVRRCGIKVILTNRCCPLYNRNLRIGDVHLISGGGRR